MIRTLLMIAGAGFIVAVVCLTAAWAIGARDVSEHGWSFPDDWHVSVRDDDDDDRDHGAAATREIAWTGATNLAIDAPASVRYSQKPGPGKVEITGPGGVIDDITIRNGEISLDTSSHNARRVTIEVRAPAINHFDVGNRGRLTIEGYDQDRLELSLAGRSSADVQGRTRSLVLSMSGRGDADLGRLNAADAKVAISGAGEASIAPTASADIGISGAGQVTLLTHPPTVRSDISGNGRLTEAGGSTTPQQPAPPAPPTKR